MFLFYVFIFILGLIIGSFLNVVIYRLWEKKDFIRGRSFCPYCKHALNWKDLIPLLSFLILRGKCRYCKKSISWQYPLVEIGAAILFVLIFWHLDFGFDLDLIWILDLIYYWLVGLLLIIIFAYDLKHYIIPDKIVYPTIIIVLLYWLLENWLLKIGDLNHLLYPLFSATGASVFFLVIVIISRGKWMGMGDVKLAFLMGLFLGFPEILTALFFAFFIGAIIGIGLVLVKRKTLKNEIPFGPFLVTGTFISLFWGEKIIQWYLHLFIG